MSGGSGLLDIERRAELAFLERLRGFDELLDIVGAANANTAIVQWKDASNEAQYPSAYVQAYNMAEYGANTGCYLGGVRLGGVTYIDDDVDKAVCRQFLGAFRSFAQQIDLVSLLNGTTSAQTVGSYIWFYACELDIHGTGGNEPYIMDPQEGEIGRFMRANQAIFELTVVCMPSRP